MAKLVFLTSRFPFPLSKGDRLRVYFQLKYLSRNHEIHLIAIHNKPVPESDILEISPFCKSVTLFVLPMYKRLLPLLFSPFKKRPMQVAYFYHQKIQRQIEKLIANIGPDHIHCHLIRTAEYAKHLKVPKSLDFMDAFGKGMGNREKMEKNFFKRMLFRYEKKQLYRYESRMFDCFDAFCIISNQDKQFIRSDRASEIQIVPNGVDFSAFYPRNDTKQYDLVFMGNLDYPPNVFAIRFLCEEIMPLVKKKNPGIRLLIAGQNAPAEILGMQSEHIDVVQKFQHISDSLAMSKIMIAPLKIHIGLPNKVLQAMAMKIPCIVSSLACNSIGATGQNCVMVADTAIEFSNAIAALLTEPEKASAIGQSGYDFVKNNYSWEQQDELLSQLLQHTK